VSKRDRRDGDHRGERRDSQPEDEQQRRSGETDMQESDSLTALKAILSKVSTLLRPLQLTQEESIRLVEQLYGKVLETDLQLAGETDDTRKSSVLAAIQNATIRREGDKIVVDYSTANTDTPEAGRVEAGPAGSAAPELASSQAAATEPAPVETAPRRPAPRRAAPTAPAPAEADPRDS
jgi:hypothetical protein